MPFAELILLAALPLLLVASAFFSGCETALFSLSRYQRLQLSRSRSFAAATVTTLLAETRSLLITLLLGNMTINVAYFVVSTVVLVRLKTEHQAGTLLVGVLSVVPLLILILLGEVVPKLLASRLAQAWSRYTAVPLLLVHRVLAPLRALISAVVIGPLARLFAPGERPPTLSAEELETLLELSTQQGVIDHEEEHLLQQVLELSQLKVRDLMTPRVDIKAFDLADPPDKLTSLIRATRLSHVPVYRGDLDHIAGVVSARQVLLAEPQTQAELRALIREAKFVPEQQRADQLLVDLRKTGTTFAMVVDEYGGTAGLITLEDVVEELVGEIAGPYASAQGPQVESIGPGRWRVSANLPVHDWGQVFDAAGGIPRDSGIEGVSTVGGLVMARLGRLPKVGDRTTFGNVAIEVETMDRRRVGTLLVQLQEATGSGQQAAGNKPLSKPQDRGRA
ncbi:MAG: hemolysin family protein [Phycisphaeraceae bacterium]